MIHGRIKASISLAAAIFLVAMPVYAAAPTLPFSVNWVGTNIDTDSPYFNIPNCLNFLDYLGYDITSTTEQVPFQLISSAATTSVVQSIESNANIQPPTNDAGYFDDTGQHPFEPNAEEPANTFCAHYGDTTGNGFNAWSTWFFRPSDVYDTTAGHFYIKSATGTDYYSLYTVSSNNINFATGTNPGADSRTRIIDFTPEDGATSSNPVNFSLHAYINPADIGTQYQIAFTLHNIDQNVLLLSALSPSDIYLLDNVVATTSGDFYYSTSTTIGEGNYRINAVLQKNILWGWLKDPFAAVNENLSHQFVVGTPTLIGSLTQNGYSELNGYLASSTATSSISLIESSCNPLSGFSMTGCLTGLFVPDTQALNTTITGFQQGVLQRAPWGYFSRIYAILSATTTATLPSYTVNIALNNASDTTTLTFNPGDMIAGAGALLASTTDPYDHKNLRDVAEPIVQLVVALGVVLTIFADLTGSHRHQQSAESVRTRRV